MSIERLRPYLTAKDRSLVFFVGAGASVAGNSGMPGTPALLHQLLLEAITISGAFAGKHDEIAPILKAAGNHIGFEITLNDFWQICRQATTLLFKSFADIESGCTTNHVHAFLAHWLSTGGTVLTTNYDRLIEREWLKTGQLSKSRYQEEDFIHWQDDLDMGGCLFKIHGSLDVLESCLGVLEHVGTKLTGQRAELLKHVVRTRPLCFVGWRGVDPDIPPLLQETLQERDALLPIFWIHYEGNPPGSITVESAIEGCSAPIRLYASANPILTEADRAFGDFLGLAGIRSQPNPERQTATLDFSEAISICSRSGLARMAGITLRRIGQYALSVEALSIALELAGTPEERSAAMQEISLAQQQTTGRDTARARTFLQQAREALSDTPDPHLQANIDFGLLSMTIVNLNSRPWLLLRLPRLFRQYRRDIGILRRETTDRESVALHESLLSLYLGRLRFKLLGWLGVIVHPLARWILSPFDTAYATIGEAKDINLHARVDVLAYRAVALANLQLCENARREIPEIDRLIAILNDHARELHWIKQRSVIENHCQKSF